MNNVVPIIIGAIAWVPVIILKVILILIGLPLLAIVFWLDKDIPSLYRQGVGRPLTWWELAIRNPVGGFGFILLGRYPKRPYTIHQLGEVLEATEGSKRFQWRIRYKGILMSFRALWIYNASKYGEVYIGWKLGSSPDELDFALSFRPYAQIGQ